jgi:hypothetical protein
MADRQSVVLLGVCACVDKVAVINGGRLEGGDGRWLVGSWLGLKVSASASATAPAFTSQSGEEIISPGTGSRWLLEVR